MQIIVLIWLSAIITGDNTTINEMETHLVSAKASGAHHNLGIVNLAARNIEASKEWFKSCKLDQTRSRKEHGIINIKNKCNRKNNVGRKRKRHKMSTHKRKKRLRKNRHKKKLR
jgi:hypothetical protein